MMADVGTIQSRWIAQAPPHRLGGSSHVDIMRAWTLAAGIVGLCGALLYGPAAAKVLLVAIFFAMATDFVVGYARARPVVGGFSHASLTGLLLGLTLPATVPWYIPAIGAVVAVVFGKIVFGGLGHFCWQPALVGRVVVQLLFLPTLSLSQIPTWPVLAPGHLLIGRLDQPAHIESAGYGGWRQLHSDPSVEAISMGRPVQMLRSFAQGRIEPDENLSYEPLLREMLPPWEDTVLGLVPGGIGETCVLGLIVAGLYLIYRGFLRWQMPVIMLASAAAAAALLPVESGGPDGGYDWFPVFAVEQGRAVGVAYVLYHLTSGELMLGAFLLAGDMMTTPMRARGQAIFAAGVGILTIFMRLYGVVECECYWSILAMNTLVGVIDGRIKRRVLGMESE